MIQQLITKELATINRMFQQNGIMAKATAKATICVETAYISYGLTVAMSEKFARVEAVQRELSNLLSQGRARMGLDAIQVIPTSIPRLALEVPHPSPKTLLWSPRKVTTGQPHTMSIGRSYLDRPKDETIRFDDAPHVLICGITGAGKSMLLQTMLLSLCAATSPKDLRLVLVDLKNEDLVPFERLPHVLTFAGTKAAAADAIRFVVAEKDRRVEQRGYKPYRLVLVVDELAQLSGNSEMRDALGDLASIGRSKAINLLGATQTPTEKGGLGSLLKANFPARLVGMVAPGQSYVATGRPQTHADLLPGKGAFLRCEGPNVYRFQSYFIDANDVTAMAKYIAKDVWGGAIESPKMPTAKPAVEVQSVPTVRDETDDIAEKIKDMVAQGASKNAICKAVFGRPYGGSYATKIDAAITRLSTTKASTLPSTTTSTDTTHTSTGNTDTSSSRSGDDSGKVIRLRKAG